MIDFIVDALISIALVFGILGYAIGRHHREDKR